MGKFGAAYSSQDSSSISDLEKQAREKGYSPQQIEALKQYYGASGRQGRPQAPSAMLIEDSSWALFDSSDYSDSDSVSLFIDSLGDSLKNDSLARIASRYYGYSLFTHIPEAFKPNSFGPVDPGYVVGPGDLLRLSVWGEVEFQYELRVSREGKIFIPVAGQVYVTGVPFEQLQQKLRTILSKHYSGLASQPQKSFMDLSVASLRPIRIFVMGEVNAPGGYTVSSSSTAFNALYSIGGPAISGSLRNIRVIRGDREIAELDIYQYLTTGRCTTDVRLQNDDVLFVPTRGKTVAVSGSVFRPSIYELKEPENLQSLLRYCGGVLPETNVDHALVHRVVPFDRREPSRSPVEVIDLDLRRFLDGTGDFPLFHNDTLKVTPLSYDLRNYALIRGEVHYPGMYQCDSLSLFSLIFDLGKPLERRAYTKRADLVRLNDDRVTFTTIPIDLERLRKDPGYDRPLRPFDEVVVYEKEVEKPHDLQVTIDGEVRRPGIYTMTTNQTVVDAILQAGGMTRSAYRKSVDVFRMNTAKDTNLISQAFSVEIPDSLDYVNPHRIFLLKDRDRIVVRPNPDYIRDNYVIIDGLVRYKGIYALEKRGERLSDVIRRAGGLLPDAFLGGATVTRNKKRLIVDFEVALNGAGSRENIFLQKFDSIYIPTRPNTVLIAGNVNNPGLFSYVKKTKLRSYIERAGGLADSSSFILLKSPGGETRKVRKRGIINPVVLEGSEIFVMKKPAKEKTEQKQGPTVTELLRDTLAILASAFTVIGLAVQLKK